MVTFIEGGSSSLGGYDRDTFDFDHDQAIEFRADIAPLDVTPFVEDDVTLAGGRVLIAAGISPPSLTLRRITFGVLSDYSQIVETEIRPAEDGSDRLTGFRRSWQSADFYAGPPEGTVDYELPRSETIKHAMAIGAGIMSIGATEGR